jgi:hypothetical protein
LLLKTCRLQQVNGDDPVRAATTATRIGTKLSYCHDPEFVIDLNIAQGCQGISAVRRKDVRSGSETMHDEHDNL